MIVQTKFVILSVCIRTIKRMLALALKVYTQRMFIISEAHQGIVVVNANYSFVVLGGGAWDATILVCSMENTI